MAQEKIRLLVNLPPTFFTVPSLRPYFQRLEGLATLRQTSHDTQEQLAPDLAWAEAVLMWAWPDLDDATLDQAPNLRFVGQINTTRTTVRTCLTRGVTISEVRHCWSPAVAEMALALILCGLRKVSDYHAAMRRAEERWVRQTPADIDPLERELAGMAVGIVGFGRIGQRLAELLRPFHVTLRIYDPFIPEAIARKHHASPAPLLDLARESDVVVLCAANTEEARHLVDREVIAAFKANAVLVNVGRSMLVDTQALLERLEQGDLIAMLDVFDQEPLEPDSPLRRVPNAYLTPHRAGGLYSSIGRALTMLADDLEAFLAGKERRYAVTEAMLACFAG